ncbi:MAG: TIR domain-containing protein [Planctomycetota bacterium]
MASLFINYRWRDSAGHAGRLFDRLAAHFGADQVFMDIDDIEPGQDIFQVVDAKLAACRTLLVVIGREWLAMTDDKGRRRLDAPEDLVRAEIVSAFAHNLRVIPVLVGGAAMPSAADLPEPLRELPRRLAHTLRDERFALDVAELIQSIDDAMTERASDDALLDGDWRADVKTRDGHTYVIRFQFETLADRVIGTVSFPTGDGVIVDGKLDGARLTFSTRHLPQFDSVTATTNFHGQLAADRLDLLMQGPASSAKFTARRVR